MLQSWSIIMCTIMQNSAMKNEKSVANAPKGPDSFVLTYKSY